MSGLTGNNMLGGSSGQSTGYDIERSVVFGTNSYFTRTPSSASNRKTWTWSGWVKRGNLGTNQTLFQQRVDSDGSQQFQIQFRADDTIRVIDQSGSATQGLYDTTAVYRDSSAWYHIVVACDTTNATASDRVKLYVNGARVTNFSAPDNWPLNYDTSVNNTVRALIGAQRPNGSSTLSNYFDGYLAEVNLIDGTVLDASSFGETNSDTNQWQAIKYTGSYGTNGFYLDFATRATDPIDASGNGNNWSSANVIAGDWKTDSPTNNFCTLSPLWVPPQAPSARGKLSEGNLSVSSPDTSSAGYNGATLGTIGVASGKWYFEYYAASANYPAIGIAKTDYNQNFATTNVGNRVWLNSGYLYGTGSSASGTTWTTGDIVGCAVDMDNGKMWFSKNGTFISSGDPAAGSNAQFSDLLSGSDMSSFVTPFWSDVNWGTTDSGVLNFGQDSSFAGVKTAQGNGGVGEDFYYTPPTGYKALNTDNLDDPAIALPTDYFNTVPYTGNGTAIGSGGLTVTGVGFQPDFTWVKQRNTTRSHNLYNSVVGAIIRLESNNSDGEATDAESLSSWNSDGFVVGNRNSVNNSSSDTYVSWNWKAGGTAVSNSDGSYTSSVSANTTAGFSIVSYTANGGSSASFGHGLSQAPELVICKNRSAAYGWATYNAISGADYALYLNTNAAAASDSNTFPDAPSSTVVNLGSSSAANGRPSNTDSMIAYCWHSVEGYSKVGSYSGNSSDDGPFIYTGFEPSWVLIKCFAGSSSQEWIIFDNKRSSYNLMDDFLYPNTSDSESSGNNRDLDFVSNGIKFRGAGGPINISGRDYLYLAFAESPFKYSNAR